MDRNQKLPEEQQEHHKHYCHICREGLNSERALGEHMRSHEITDEHISNPDEDTTTTTDMEIYDSRNNPNPHQTSHICENRGEAFRSWKSFYEHNHCCSVASTGGEEDDPNGHSQSSSSSRSYYIVKRTDRDEKPNGSTHSPPHLLTEDEDVVNCLLMLSGATRVKPLLRIADREECSTSISKEADDDIPTTPSPQLKPQVPTLTPPISRGFECKDCKKTFPSHQALGGHRASHKKVKGCFAACLQVEAHGTDNALMEDENNNINHKNNRVSSSKKNKVLSIVPIAENSQQEVPNMKSKGHICSVCERQFASGQALGGHKRCHWITSKSTAASVFNVEPISMVAPNLQIEFCSSGEYLMHPHTQPLLQINNSNHQPLDLNQPEPMDDLVEISQQLDMPLQLGGDVEKKTNMNKCTTTSNNNIEEEKTSNQNMDDEAESEEVKLAKLWDLKDMDEGVERSTWLQLGTGSMSDQQNSDNQS